MFVEYYCLGGRATRLLSDRVDLSFRVGRQRLSLPSCVKPNKVQVQVQVHSLGSYDNTGARGEYQSFLLKKLESYVLSIYFFLCCRSINSLINSIVLFIVYH